MSNLVVELLLRFAKAGIAGVLAAGLWLVVTGPLGEPGTPLIALLCWSSAATFVLLVESSPL